MLNPHYLFDLFSWDVDLFNLYCSLAFLNNLWLALLLTLPYTIYILVQPRAFIVRCLTRSKSTNHQANLIPYHSTHTTCPLRRENSSIHINFEQRSRRWNPCKENKVSLTRELLICKPKFSSILPNPLH